MAANTERSAEARPSVRAELKKYRDDIEKTADKAKTPEKALKVNEHKAVKKKKAKERG